jgi:uncharacterized protein (TIGR04206 family)
MDLRPPVRRLVAVLLLGVAPWVVVRFPGQFDMVFSWGWINSYNWNVVTMWEYLFEYTLGLRSLPRHLQAWPVATVLYLCALTSASSGAAVATEDRRVTAGLLVLAALSILRYTIGFNNPRATVVPLFIPAVLVVCWWAYADVLTPDQLVSKDREEQ